MADIRSMMINGGERVRDRTLNCLNNYINTFYFIINIIYSRMLIYSFHVPSITVDRRASSIFIFCLYISPRSLSFTLVTSFISYCAYHLLVKQYYSTYLVILNQSGLSLS